MQGMQIIQRLPINIKKFFFTILMLIWFGSSAQALGWGNSALEDRVIKMEEELSSQKNAASVRQLSEQLEDLQHEVRQLRGRIEEQEYQVKVLEKRQQGGGMVPGQGPGGGNQNMGPAGGKPHGAQSNTPNLRDLEENPNLPPPPGPSGSSPAANPTATTNSSGRSRSGSSSGSVDSATPTGTNEQLEQQLQQQLPPPPSKMGGKPQQ